jgi:hypothetical protein
MSPHLVRARVRVPRVVRPHLVRVRARVRVRVRVRVSRSGLSRSRGAS